MGNDFATKERRSDTVGQAQPAATQTTETAAPTASAAPVAGLSRPATAAAAAPSVRRWPFGKKTEAEKQAEEDKKQKRLAVKEEKGKAKAADAKARLDAKAVNSTHAAVSQKIGAGYQDGANHDKMTPEHQKLALDFQHYLDLEKKARTDAKAKLGPGATPDAIETAEDEAAEAVWDTAPDEVRSMRSLRYDPFDKALKEAQAMLNESRVAEHGEASLMMQDNEKNHGAPMTMEAAIANVRDNRSLERAGVRAAQKKGADPEVEKQLQKTKAEGDAQAKIAETQAKRPVSKGEQDRISKETATDANLEANGPNRTIAKAQGAVDTAGTVSGGAGKAIEKGTDQVTKRGIGGAKEGRGSDISGMVGASAQGLKEVLSFISQLLSFASTIGDIRKGTAEPDAKYKAAKQAVASTTGAAGATKAGLSLAKEGVEKFGGASSVISQAGQAIPIVGLVTSVLGVMDNAIDLVPVSMRLASGVENVDAAILAGKAPIAAGLDRVNSRNAQLVEQSTFDIGKNATMVGLHIAEIASAGGFGIPMAAKLTVSITGLAHTLGHKVYDTVMESKSSTAKKEFGVKHQEGASRDVLKYDIGSSMAVLIAAARKHVPYARAVLVDYGVTDTEIDSMRPTELLTHCMEKLKATEDPKTVSEKVEEAVSKVKSAVGMEDAPPGTKVEEKTVSEKLKETPGKIVDFLKSIPKKINEKVQDVKAKHADAKELIATKNQMGYKGNTTRGTGAVLQHMFRGSDSIEKSYEKVRQEKSANGTAAADLPRSTQNKKDRAAQEAAEQQRKQAMEDGKGGAKQIDPAYIEKATKATAPQLQKMIDAISPGSEEAELYLQFLQAEVQRRLEHAGALS